MGTYCTTTALDTAMIGVTFDTATTAIATECIDWAENEIDKFLSKRYDLSANTFQTSTSVPPMVQTLCKWLAIGYTYEASARGGKDAFTRGDRYIKRAIDNLEMLADYKLDLVDSSGDVIDDMSQTGYRILANTETYSETFNEDDPLDWKIDSDKLSDIADGRD